MTLISKLLIFVCGSSGAPANGSEIELMREPRQNPGPVRKTKTISGIPCQMWNSQYPHSHSQYGTQYNDNYCRNPSNYLGGNWCYTQNPNVRWELCQPSERTKSGYYCQKWAATFPHNHNFLSHTHGVQGNECSNPDNSPGGDWCYTTDFFKRWEYCPAKRGYP